MRRILYAIAQCTWGLPQTLAGGAVFLAHARKPHFLFHGAIVTVWESSRGLSLGPFIFIGGRGAKETARGSEAIAANVDRRLLVHEYGHTIQSLVLGPAYLLVIGLPSALWMNVPAFARLRRTKGVSYYRFLPERTANWLGERALGEPSPGQ